MTYRTLFGPLPRQSLLPSSAPALPPANSLFDTSTLSPAGALANLLLKPSNPPPPAPDAWLQALITPAPQAPLLGPWRFVRQRFMRFHGNLELTVDQLQNGHARYAEVVACLNRHYRNLSVADFAVPIGSWGKGTRGRPLRDIDILYVLPDEVYWRFEQRQGNRQSDLLQENREVLARRYTSTEIRGNGQVVTIAFETLQIEVALAFRCADGSLLGCDTSGQGRYRRVDPAAELTSLNDADIRFNGNVRKLTRMLKQWQRHCNVPLKSFHIEALVKELLPTLWYGMRDEFWFDWLVRDFFARLVNSAHGYFIMPGTLEVIYLGADWLSRAQTAHARAVKACAYEQANLDELAGEEWQKIFGTMVPRSLA